MAAPPELLSLAGAVARARRFWLLGRDGPWFGRAAAEGEPEADASEHGERAVQLAVVVSRAADLDEGLGALRRATVERPGQERCTPAQALAAISLEEDPEEREGLARALARALPGALEMAAAAWAGCVEEAAERGAPALASARELAAAETVLAATEDPARDVLEWATLGSGRARRSQLAWTDVARALRLRSLDASFPSAREAWPTLRAWREAAGLWEPHFESCTASGFFGSWAVRRGSSLTAGASAWPGALLWRFSLQALGRADVLRDAGDPIWLPADEGSAELLPALYPSLLADRAFLDRAARLRPAGSKDDARRLALSEVLLARLQAAAMLTQAAFERARALSSMRDAAADSFRRALFAPVPPELGLLSCSPWSPPLASPRATLAAAGLAETLRERFDFDWWRNPAAAPELRRLAASAAQSELRTLVPERGEAEPYRRWVIDRLGA